MEQEVITANVGRRGRDIILGVVATAYGALPLSLLEIVPVLQFLHVARGDSARPPVARGGSTAVAAGKVRADQRVGLGSLSIISGAVMFARMWIAAP